MVGVPDANAILRLRTADPLLQVTDAIITVRDLPRADPAHAYLSCLSFLKFKSAPSPDVSQLVQRASQDGYWFLCSQTFFVSP